MPLTPLEMYLYYAAISLFALILFIRRRPRGGMRLNLRAGFGRKRGAESPRNYSEIAAQLKASGKLEVAHSRPRGADPERSLNVVFNYNGHSWDAHEVLGVPAGSSFEKVEAGYRTTLARVDDESKPFVEAAFQAIRGQEKKVAN